MSPSSPRTSSGASLKKNEELNYETAYAELEKIVEALEAEGRSLDETLALYERGQLLAAHCANLLEKAELKVRQLGVDGLVEPEGQE